MQQHSCDGRLDNRPEMFPVCICVKHFSFAAWFCTERQNDTPVFSIEYFITLYLPAAK